MYQERFHISPLEVLMVDFKIIDSPEATPKVQIDRGFPYLNKVYFVFMAHLVLKLLCLRC